MLVYGDRTQAIDPRELVTEIEASVTEAGADVVAWRRRDRFRAALIAAGQLVQGLADLEFEASACDDLTPLQGAVLALAVAVAAAFLRVRRDPSSTASPSLAAELMALRDQPLPRQVTCRTPEGYAFYAVYPEHYATAVERELSPSPPAVVGIRSIGTGLAATVAAATGASLVFTVRPFGPAHRRQIRISASLRERLAAHSGPILLVDEGPGLSGSSFGAVADLLESLGVARQRIVFLPSHWGDPGPRASRRDRGRWQNAQRRVWTLDDRLRAEPIAGWFAEQIGPVRHVEDISGGEWRADLPADRRPPAWPAQERRKFRLTTARGVYVARFAGLGAFGEAKFRRARILHSRGFTPEPVAFHEGFLLERWARGDPMDPTPDRPEFLQHLARYLGYRARHFPANRDQGASFASLAAMAVNNAGELGGPALGDAVAARLEAIGDPTPRLRPAHIDGRLQSWEWIRTPQGRLLKTDALDHSCGHDLVGCQDVAWDVAGAASEWRLTADEVATLARGVSEASGTAVSLAAVCAFRLCYAAFQAALWSMAAESASGTDRSTIARWRERHVTDLRRLASVDSQT